MACGPISEIVTAEKIDRGYVGSILRLTLLAPDIVEAILDGGLSVALSLTRGRCEAPARLPQNCHGVAVVYRACRAVWFGPDMTGGTK